MWVQNCERSQRAQRNGPASPEIGPAPTVSREVGRQQPASRPCHKTDQTVLLTTKGVGSALWTQQEAVHLHRLQSWGWGGAGRGRARQGQSLGKKQPVQ